MKYLFILFPFFINSQNLFQLYEIGKFPPVLNETSGIEATDSNTIWTHTDSGGEASLYKTSSNGTLLKKVKLINASNIDFEDICFAHDGKVFIGDFGNNNNDRKNLRIFCTTIADLETKDNVFVDTISFAYPDQTLFPPDVADRNFDCEAFFYSNQYLYLFTKHRGNYNFTKCYRIPAIKGIQIPILLDSFATSTWITAADISPNGKKIALLSETKLQLFENFKADSFFHGNYSSISYTLSQKEGVVFVTDDLLFLSDEQGFLPGGKIFKMYLKLNADTSKIDTSKSELVYAKSDFSLFMINGRPIKIVHDGLEVNSEFTIQIFNANGRMIIEEVNKHLIEFPILYHGIYTIRLLCGKRIFVKKIVY